ncbi:LysR family transcriptional regulator [Kitasatospora sp. NPDC058218]|uniref:helix-turn-helix domain-containing protein n=1 Tax=Kitasatospora sp. NPDC058218 TaxID=3346385 RepID=UPI0036DD11B9
MDVMDVTEVPLTALRVLRAVAEQGTFTAAAGQLGHTRSVVSRQIASIERLAGTPPQLARLPGPLADPVARVATALRAAAIELDAEP